MKNTLDDEDSSSDLVRDASSSVSAARTLPPDKSGWLYKRGALNSSWRKRWFVLRYQTLKYYKHQKDTKPKGSITLANSTIERADLSDPSDRDRDRTAQFGFLIKSTTYSRVFMIHALSLAEQQEWILAITLNIAFINRVDDKEMEKRAAAAAVTVNQQRKQAPSSIPLSLSISDDFIRRSGIPLRWSAWRKPQSLAGLATEQPADKSSSSISVSLLPISSRIPDVSCATVHNMENALAVGCAASDDLKHGAVQIINTQQSSTSQHRTTFTPTCRFGKLLSAQKSTRDNDDDHRGAGSGSGSGDDDDEDEDSKESKSILGPIGSGECTSISWYDDKLLCGSSGGVVALYHASPSEPVSGSLTPVATFHHSKLRQVSTAAPGRYTQSSCIRRVAINPVDKQTFIAIANQSFYIWRLDHPSSPDYAEMGSIAPLFAVAWNPLSPSQFMFGGQRHTLKMLDERLLSTNAQKCVIWKSGDAHDDVIRDIAWSPLVQHWVASAGDDAVVKVWDLRYGRYPVRELVDHTSGVCSVSWSRSHCELLLTGSHDRSIRLWNLRIQPHAIINRHTEFDGSIIHTNFSPVSPLQYLGVSSTGECALLQMERQFLAQFASHRAKQNISHAPTSAPDSDDDDDAVADKKTPPTTTTANATSGSGLSIPVRSEADEAAEHSIETWLYLRDFDAAFAAIAELANKYWEDKSYEFAAAILKLTSTSLFNQAVQDFGGAGAAGAVSPSSSSTSAANAAARLPSFTALVNDLARYIPLSTLKLTKVDLSHNQRIHFLKLRLALLKLMEANKYKDVLALEKDICSHLEKTGSFDAATLESLVHSIMPYDHLRGLEFSMRIARTLKDANQFGLFVGIARFLFSPTIYETLLPEDANLNEDSSDEDSSSESRSQSEDREPSSRRATTAATAAATPLSELRSAHHPSRLRSASSSIGPSATPASRLLPNQSSRRALLPSPSSSALGLGSGPSSSSSVNLGLDHLDRDAQLTLDRDLRNPKVVLSQLQLMYNLFQAMDPSSSQDADDKDDRRGGGGGGGGSKEKDAAPTRYNPFQADALSQYTLDTLHLPPISSTSAKSIIRMMDGDKDHRKLLSNVVHRIYFTSLIQTKKYDVLFIQTLKLISHIKNYPFSQYLHNMLQLTAIPKFSKFISRNLVRDPAQPWATSRLIAASLTIINMVFNCEYLPDPLPSTLPQSLQQCTEQLQRAFKELLTNKSYVPMDSADHAHDGSSSFVVTGGGPPSAAADVRARADHVLQQMAKIRAMKSAAEHPLYEQQVDAFAEMVHKFRSMN